ncbi:MAG: TAXI family TRAP transporter solute-binding subunit, partial [Sulfolobales archaeon]
MSTQKSLIGVLVVLIIIAGVGGYFAGSAAVPPPKTITSVVTQTVTVTVTATPTPTVTPIPPSPPPHWPKEIIIRVGGIGGAWYPIGAGLGDLITKNLKVRATVQPGGSGPNILATSKDEADIVMAYAWQSAVA